MDDILTGILARSRGAVEVSERRSVGSKILSMSITIENPTAEAIFQALREVPAPEIERLRQLLEDAAPRINESDEWNEADLRDLDLHTARLIDERFGPEEGNYD